MDKYGRRWDATEQSPYVVYRRENCTEHVRLRDELAPDLLRRRRVAEAPLGARQRLRPARRRHVGAGLRRRPPRALPGARRVVPRGQGRAPGGRQGCSPPRSSTRASSSRWAAKDASTRRQLRRPGLGRTAARWTTWLTGTTATSDVWLGSRRHGLRVPRPGAGQQGHTWARGTSVSTWDATPTLARRRLRPRRRPTASPTAPGPTPSAARLGTLDAGTIVARDARARSRPTATPGTRSPSRSGSGARSRSWSAASGSPLASSTADPVKRVPRPEQHAREGRHPGPRLRRDGERRGDGGGAGRRAALLAQRRRLRGRPRGSAGRTP